MEIYLVRHGQCDTYAREYYDQDKKAMNPPLTDKGIYQARLTAKHLHPVPFDRINRKHERIQSGEIFSMRDKELQ